MNKQELYDYIMKSPYNTNPTILKQAIEGLSNNDSNSGDSGGAVTSGVKIAIFDFAKINEYQTIVLDETTFHMLFKISDDIPTYNELLGGFIGSCGRINFDTGDVSITERFEILNESNMENVEEMQSVTILDSLFMSVSAATAEMLKNMLGVDVPLGLYLSSQFIDVTAATGGTMYHVLIWGFE